MLTRRRRVQAHPEFTSKVLHPSPAILGFVAAGAGCLDAMIEAAGKRKMVNGNGDGFSF
jgi:CTP synthase